MNIDDVQISASEVPDGNFVRTMFQLQYELMHKYESIEARNGAIVPVEPWDIDDPKVQMRLKDMFWRFTEEIAESLENFHLVETLLPMWRDQWAHNAQVRHLFEELADALHFLIEASLICGFPTEAVECHGWRMASSEIPGKGAQPDLKLKLELANVVMTLGLAANCLKNKPWKNTHMLTDRNRFMSLFSMVWQRFITVWTHLGFDVKQVYVLYSKKLKVNQFRQATNY